MANCLSAHPFTDTFTDSGQSSLRKSLRREPLQVAPKVGLEATIEVASLLFIVGFYWIYLLFNMRLLPRKIKRFPTIKRNDA